MDGVRENSPVQHVDLLLPGVRIGVSSILGCRGVKGSSLFADAPTSSKSLGLGRSGFILGRIVIVGLMISRHLTDYHIKRFEDTHGPAVLGLVLHLAEHNRMVLLTTRCESSLTN